MFVFWKTCRALFSYNNYFEIDPFALLLTNSIAFLSFSVILTNITSNTIKSE